MIFTFAFLSIITFYMFINNLYHIMVLQQGSLMSKRRIRQLSIKPSIDKKEKELKDLIDIITIPVELYIMPRLKKNFDLENLRIKLKLAKWDNIFTPKKYIAFNISTKIIAVLVFLILSLNSIFLAIIWGVVIAFAVPFLLNNTVDSKKERIISEFPDFVILLETYLDANYPFVLALREIITEVGSEWRDILKDLIITSETYSIDVALDNLKRDIDLFEIKEFVAFIKMSLDQGGDIKEGLQRQIEKIEEMQELNIEKILNRRKSLAIVVQAPLLLANVLAFGLPIAMQVVEIF